MGQKQCCSKLMPARIVVFNCKKCTFGPIPDQPCNIFWYFLLQTYSYITRYPTVCCLTKPDDFQSDPHFRVLICLSAYTENGFLVHKVPPGWLFWHETRHGGPAWCFEGAVCGNLGTRRCVGACCWTRAHFSGVKCMLGLVAC